MTTAQYLYGLNYVHIVFLFIAGVYQIMYFVRHRNGKRMLRLWGGLVCLAGVVLRAEFAANFIDADVFTLVWRPFSLLIVMIPMADAYVDWCQHE